MPYIAKVSGSDVVELRVGLLSDIPANDVVNWRTVVEVGPQNDRVCEIRKIASITLVEPNVEMVWTVERLPEAWCRMRLKEYAGNKRWQVETGGTLVGDVPVATDDAAQRKISELRRRAEASEISLPFEFKSQNGWISLGLAAIQGVDQAVSAHVQASYATEKAVSDAIDAGTVTTTADIDGYAWP